MVLTQGCLICFPGYITISNTWQVLPWQTTAAAAASAASAAFAARLRQAGWLVYDSRLSCLHLAV